MEACSLERLFPNSDELLGLEANRGRLGLALGCDGGGALVEVVVAALLVIEPPEADPSPELSFWSLATGSVWLVGSPLMAAIV